MGKKLIGIIGICLLLSVLVYIPGTSYGADKEVIYLSLADYTGPSGGLDSYIQMGTEDYFKYLNDKGGVQGIKVKFIGVDTHADVARVVSGYKRYRRTPKNFVFWNNSTPANKVVLPLATRDKRIMHTPASGEAVAKPGYAFCWGQTYQDGFGASLDWMLQDWKNKGKTGTPTVGYFSWDNSYGYAHLQGGKEYAQMKGIKLLFEFFRPGTMDHTTYLTRLKGCDYIFVGGVDPTPGNVIRDAHRLGMGKTTQFICDYWGPSRGINMVHTDILQGVVIVSFYLRGKDIVDHPLAKEIWTTYRKKPLNELTGLYAAGFTLGMRYVEALKIALKDVSYDKLRNEDIYRAYHKLTGMDFQGIQTKCAYTTTERRGSKGIRFYKIKGWELEPISGWIFPFDTVKLHKWK